MSEDWECQFAEPTKEETWQNRCAFVVLQLLFCLVTRNKKSQEECIKVLEES